MSTPEDDEDRDWKELTTAQFFKGYAESDAIYDELIPRSLKESQQPRTEQLRSGHENPK